MQTEQQLSKQINKLQNTFEAIKKRKEEWQQHHRQRIFNTLQQIAQQHSLAWQVQENKERDLQIRNKNFDALQLTFQPEETDIKVEHQTAKRKGGALIYAQMHNGKINVLIEYPYIENVTAPESYYDFIGVFLPEKLTEQLIYQHTTSLLYIMNEFWEKYASQIYMD